jgi:anion-transporting  ArsA/GET3 family ATPase
VALRRLIIVTGKGGTGRSAVTAALALRSAAAGEPVLAISMAESPGLANHLGGADVGYDPVELAPGVWSMAINRRKALDEYVHVQLRLPLRAPLGAVSRALDGIADTVPGIRDAITMGKVAFEAWSDRWGVIVADAPPTGQIASYLGAPATIADLVPAGVIRRQASSIRDLLVADTTEVIITTLAEELPVAETNEAIAGLEALGFAPSVLVNRLVEELDADGVDGKGPLYDAARLHLALRASQQRWRTELPPGPELPYLFGLHTPAEVASRLADLLAK